MVVTPWGEAEELRGRMLRPVRGAARGDVEQSQRERLFAAIVALSSERGYEAVSVSDLIEMSGVSRADFYTHFADKQACFVAAQTAVFERLGGLVAMSYDGRGSALRAVIEQIVAQPAAARMCFNEVQAAGPEAVALMDEALAGFETLYATAFEKRDPDSKMPPEIPKAIVGGQRSVVFRRLLRGRESELLDVSDELWAWGMGYRQPPKPLIRKRRRARRRTTPAGPIGHAEEPVERLLASTYDTVAENGLVNTTITDIVERAEVSFSTFYRFFDSREEVFEAAVDAAEFRLFGEMVPAFRRAKSWPAGVRSALETMAAFFEAEPAIARCVLLEISAGGPRVLDRRERSTTVMQEFLSPGFKIAPDASAVAAEAIGGAVLALVADRIQAGHSDRLHELAPFLTYVTLAPFLGAELACSVARGEEPDGGSTAPPETSTK